MSQFASQLDNLEDYNDNDDNNNEKDNESSEEKMNTDGFW